MQVLSLNLTNFRNLSHKKIDFDSKLTVIVGKNGAGKSNILEALSFLSGIRPTRVETDLDLVKFGQSEAKIEGRVEVDGEEKKLVVNFVVGEIGRVVKSFFIDSFKKRLFDFVTVFSVVVFEPTDLHLVSGSPSLRRHHLDRFLSSLDVNYWRNVSSYVKIVTRRNRILTRIQEGKSKKTELNFWDERLVEHAKFIAKAREDFFDYLNFVNATEGSKDSDFSDLSWQLKISTVTLEKLVANHDRDIAAGVTLSGPHRDDFRFIFRKRDLEFFGSRGEQRMAVLALKLAELEYFKVKKGVRPILALDDIFSELDWEHRKTVLSVISNQQTIITAAEQESVPKEIFKKAKVVQI